MDRPFGQDVFEVIFQATYQKAAHLPAAHPQKQLNIVAEQHVRLACLGIA
jgi:hypothetical protein